MKNNEIEYLNSHLNYTFFRSYIQKSNQSLSQFDKSVTITAYIKYHGK